MEHIPTGEVLVMLDLAGLKYSQVHSLDIIVVHLPDGTISYLFTSNGCIEAHSVTTLLTAAGSHQLTTQPQYQER